MVAFLARWSAFSGIVMNDSADRKVAIFTEALQFSTEERTAYCAGFAPETSNCAVKSTNCCDLTMKRVIC